MPFNDPERGRTFSAQTPSTAKELIEAMARAANDNRHKSETWDRIGPKLREYAISDQTAALRALLPYLEDLRYVLATDSNPLNRYDDFVNKIKAESRSRHPCLATAKQEGR